MRKKDRERKRKSGWEEKERGRKTRGWEGEKKMKRAID